MRGGRRERAAKGLICLVDVEKRRVRCLRSRERLSHVRILVCIAAYPGWNRIERPDYRASTEGGITRYEIRGHLSSKILPFRRAASSRCADATGQSSPKGRIPAMNYCSGLYVNVEGGSCATVAK